jgi:hypothetical protein
LMPPPTDVAVYPLVPTGPPRSTWLGCHLPHEGTLPSRATVD